MSMIVRRGVSLLLALGLFTLSFSSNSSITARADEGLWTFDNPPLKQLKERYNFEPTREWLEHLRLASVRINEGGSGSFVSPDGLMMTNHHVAESQLAKLSNEQRDLNQTGFYARTRAEELPCPDLEINVLISLEDVTKQVQAASQHAPDLKTAADRRNAEIARLEKDSTEKTGLRTELVTLYNGGEYWLYRFKKYTDVRMVFAPERQLAFFGGDPDNFTYPRFNLDVAFMRVYENGKPARTDNYLRWSAKSVQENDLVFISGNPGGTDRLLTLTQIEFKRNVSNPRRLRILAHRRAALLKFAARGPEQKRRAESLLFGLENSFKAVGGFQEGLLDSKVMAKKREQEQELRRRVAEDVNLQQQYGSAWNEIAAAYQGLPELSNQITYSALRGSEMASIALDLILYANEVQKPNADRLEDYRDSNLESLKFSLLSPAPIYPDLEEYLVADALAESLAELGPENAFIKTVLGSRPPAEVAKEIIGGSKIYDLEFRKSLFNGGQAAIEKSNDPLIVMMRKIIPIARAMQEKFKEQVENVEVSAGEKIGKALFAIYGRSISPDANFTLRLSYGTVKGYEIGTTFVPYKTTYNGIYDRASSFDNRPPFDLSKRALERKNAINLDTPFNFVCTADTIGGNSGSPVVNRNGEVVGILFDGNIQSLVWQYLFTEETGRSVCVHSAGIIEGLRKLYDANPLADEIEGLKR